MWNQLNFCGFSKLMVVHPCNTEYQIHVLYVLRTYEYISIWYTPPYHLNDVFNPNFFVCVPLLTLLLLNFTVIKFEFIRRENKNKIKQKRKSTKKQQQQKISQLKFILFTYTILSFFLSFVFFVYYYYVLYLIFGISPSSQIGYTDK